MNRAFSPFLLVEVPLPRPMALAGMTRALGPERPSFGADDPERRYLSWRPWAVGRMAL